MTLAAPIKEGKHILRITNEANVVHELKLRDMDDGVSPDEDPMWVKQRGCFIDQIKLAKDMKTAGGGQHVRLGPACDDNDEPLSPNQPPVNSTSAGGVTAIHLAYIDDISDLPTTPLDIQAVATSLGGLEGDAGNLGYSSEVNGVISFAGGINTLSWIDANDEPIVSCQGDADQTVNYNCGPGLNNPSVLTLCGAGEMHPQADLVGVLNDKLIFPGEGHTWFVGGDSNPLFLQALDFTKDFLYPLLPCNNTTSISEENTTNKQLIRITDMLGRNANATTNATLFYIYDDGSVEKKMILK